MGILTADTPPRRERIALRVNQCLAYGGTLLAAIVFYSSFLWVILPSPAYRARLAVVNAKWAMYFEHQNERLPGGNPRYPMPGYNFRAKGSLQGEFNHYLEIWAAAIDLAGFVLVWLPLAGWAIWSAAVFRRNKTLAAVSVRQELAGSLLTPEEVLRPRLLDANRAGLRPFLLAAPVVATLIFLEPLLRRLPLSVAPHPFAARPLGINDAIRVVENLALYLGGCLLLIGFLAPFLMMNTLLLRCVPSSAPGADRRMKAIVSARAVIFGALAMAALCLALSAFWIFYDARVWLAVSKRGMGFSAFILRPFRLCNLALFAASSAVLIFLPRWALRRQWSEVLENYYRFE